MIRFLDFECKTCCGILYFLKSSDLFFGSVYEKRIAVVKTRENERANECDCCMKCEIVANGADLSECGVCRSGNVSDVCVNSHVVREDKTKITSTGGK